MSGSIRILAARHAWAEHSNFTINRPAGICDHVFLHFLTPVELRLNGTKHQLTAGSFLFYRAGSPQWFHSEGPLRHNWMHLQGDLDSSLQEVGLSPDTIYTVSQNAPITVILQQIEREVLTRPPMYAAFLDVKYRELLITFARSASAEQFPPSAPDMQHHFEELRAYIFENIEQNWTVAEMAARVNLSSSRFYALYQRYFHISPMEDLILARIDAARYWLSNQNFSIQELAYLLGYHSTSHFCRQFKTYTGMSPSRYRTVCLHPTK